MRTGHKYPTLLNGVEYKIVLLRETTVSGLLLFSLQNRELTVKKARNLSDVSKTLNAELDPPLLLHHHHTYPFKPKSKSLRKSKPELRVSSHKSLLILHRLHCVKCPTVPTAHHLRKQTRVS